MRQLSDKARAVVVLAAAATAIAVLAGVMVVQAQRAGRPDRLEHTTVSAPERLPAVGPRPWTFGRAWQNRVDTVDDHLAVTVAGPHVLVATEHGLRAYDARTGKASWSYRELDGKEPRELTSFGVTAGAVVATFEGTDRDHVVGLDAGSGEQLWDRTEDWVLAVEGREPDTVTRPADAAAGVVVALPPLKEKRYGVDARTGKVRWRLSDADVENDCSPVDRDEDASAGDGAVLPVVASCETGSNVYAAVDASSGDVLWSRTSGVVDAMRTAGPTAVVSTGPFGVELVGRNGRALTALPRAEKAEVFSVAGRTVVTYRERRQDPDDDEDDGTYAHRPSAADRWYEDVVTVVDRHGVTKRVSVPGTVTEQSWVAVGNRLYAVTGSLQPVDDAPLLPMGVAVVDVPSGRLDVAPLPQANQVLAAEDESTLVTRALGAGDGRLLTVTQASGRHSGVSRSTLASYRVIDARLQPELGGVSTGDWPDACRLLPRDGGTKVPGVRKRLGHLFLYRLSCRDEDVSVRVVWVGRTATQTASLFPGEASQVADEERYVSFNTTLLRVDRVVVEVATDADVLDVTAARRAVVHQLRVAQR